MTDEPDTVGGRPERTPRAARAVRAAARAVGARAARAAGVRPAGRGTASAEPTPVDHDGVDGSVDDRAEPRSIPEATVARLALYLRVLTALAEQGTVTVSSEELAAVAGVNSAKLRKDLSYLGSYGTRGVGYDVALLVERISRGLGLTTHRAVALVGIGNLGHALAGYAGFASRGFRIAALFDADTARVGERIAGLTVRHIDELEATVRAEGVSIGVIATPAHAAQDVCDRLVAAGVTSILNFAPAVLAVPENVDVRKVDLAVELQILSFHEQRKALGLASPRFATGLEGFG
jgi:redox-sensing transcriptional repressor